MDVYMDFAHCLIQLTWLSCHRAGEGRGGEQNPHFVIIVNAYTSAMLAELYISAIMYILCWQQAVTLLFL